MTTTNQSDLAKPGEESGLSDKQILAYANIPDNNLQLTIRKAIENGLDDNIISALASSSFTPAQKSVLVSGIEQKLPVYALNLIANPGFSDEQMQVLSDAFTAGISFKTIQAVANPGIDARVMSDKINQSLAHINLIDLSVNQAKYQQQAEQDYGEKPEKEEIVEQEDIEKYNEER